MRKFLVSVLVLLLALALFSSACQPEAVVTQPPETATEAPEPADSPEPVTEPAAPAEVFAEDTPAAVTQAFYEWYLGLIGDRADGEFRNPLVEGLYRESELLTPRFVEQVDATVSSFDTGGYDPFLLAQDIPQEVVAGDVVQENANVADVTLLRYWSGTPHPDTITVRLVQQDGTWLIDDILPAEPNAAAGHPAMAVEEYYDWYLAELGSTGHDRSAHPLITENYCGSNMLGCGLIEQVERYVEQYDPLGFDPLLLANKPPESMQAVHTEMDDTTATVTVMRTWLGYDAPLPMEVFLRREGNRWQLAELSLAMAPEAPAPAAVVEAFYSWMLAYTGDFGGEFHNIMTEEGYRDSPYLTAGFIAQLDELKARRAEEQVGGSDPFWCAQDVPPSFVVESAFMNEDRPLVLVRTPFFQHYIVVELEVTGDDWQIDDIHCTNSPAGAATAFYTWYLGTIGDRSDGTFVNPLVEGTYRESPFLAEALIAQVDETLAAQELGGGDPFLQAQDIPVSFRVEPGADAESVIVELQFGPESVRRLQLEMENQQGRWLIGSIEALDLSALPDGAAPADGDVADWNTFLGEDYGLTFRFPPAWVISQLDMQGPGMPDDWPVVEAFQIMPKDIAEAITAQTGPPDPNAPPIVAPLSLEILEGDEQAYNRVYVPAANSETVRIGSQTVLVEREDVGVTRYVFAHPTREDLRFVFIDWLSEFPGREAQAAALEDVLTPLLESVSFLE